MVRNSYSIESTVVEGWLRRLIEVGKAKLKTQLRVCSNTVESLDKEFLRRRQNIP